MSMSQALRESYASGSTDTVDVETVELDHASSDGPLRLVRSVDSTYGNPGDVVYLPLVQGGPKEPHYICAFSVLTPGADSDGPTDGQLRIDNVSDSVQSLLENIIGYNQPVYVSFRFYSMFPGGLDSVTGPDDDAFSGLEMTEVNLDEGSCSGTIAWPDGRQQNVPSGPDAFFDRNNYPALFT